MPSPKNKHFLLFFIYLISIHEVSSNKCFWRYVSDHYWGKNPREVIEKKFNDRKNDLRTALAMPFNSNKQNPLQQNEIQSSQLKEKLDIFKNKQNEKILTSGPKTKEKNEKEKRTPSVNIADKKKSLLPDIKTPVKEAKNAFLELFLNNRYFQKSTNTVLDLKNHLSEVTIPQIVILVFGMIWALDLFTYNYILSSAKWLFHVSAEYLETSSMAMPPPDYESTWLFDASARLLQPVATNSSSEAIGTPNELPQDPNYPSSDDETASDLSTPVNSGIQAEPLPDENYPARDEEIPLNFCDDQLALITASSMVKSHLQNLIKEIKASKPKEKVEMFLNEAFLQKISDGIAEDGFMRSNFKDLLTAEKLFQLGQSYNIPQSLNHTTTSNGMVTHHCPGNVQGVNVNLEVKIGGKEFKLTV